MAKPGPSILKHALYTVHCAPRTPNLEPCTVNTDKP